MYSVGAHPTFFKIYKELGKKFNIQVLINRQLMEMVGLNPESAIEQGDFIIDKTYVGEFEYFKNGKLSSYYEGILQNLSYGVNLILIHPAFDNNEMKGVTVNHPNFGSEWRQIDFDFFTNEENRSKLNENKIELINWIDIQNRKRTKHNNG